MDSSENGKWIIPFKKFSRLRVNMLFVQLQEKCINVCNFKLICSWQNVWKKLNKLKNNYKWADETISNWFFCKKEI